VVGTLGQRGNALRHGQGRRVALLVGLSLTALSAGAAPAHASASGEPRVIHTCYDREDRRELRFNPSGGRCPDGERPLSWNRRGERGLRGRPGAETEPFAQLLLAVSLADDGDDGDEEKTPAHARGWLPEFVEEAAPVAGNAFTLLGLGILALALALSLLRWLTGLPWRWGWLRRRRWVRSLGKLTGPALQIEAFEDGAMEQRVGPSFALLAQARIDGGRETGSHLYLVTGEERTNEYIAALQGVPQTQTLALALSLFRLLWRRPRLTVSGSLKPIDIDQTAATTVSLRLDGRLIDTSEFWLSEPPLPTLTAAASNRVLAVAVAGWIEHETIDQTPGPPAGEALLSCDARSWALFRAGSELNRMSVLDGAADLYERALAIDRDNVGALVDLAHLRRLDGHYQGAKELASEAVELIERRNREFGRHDDEDPNWYRAQIVLATTYTDWVRNETAESPSPLEAREWAFDDAVKVARRAMAATDRLERLAGSRAFGAAACRDRIGWLAYGRSTVLALGYALVHGAKGAAAAIARLRARAASSLTQDRRVRRAVRVLARPWRVPVWVWRSLRATCRCARAGVAVLRRWRTFRRRAVELHALLETTFEPGALLLVVSSLEPGERNVAPPAWPPSSDRLDPLNDRRKRLKARRREIEKQLQPDGPDDLEPATLIAYVRELPSHSPRVLYNLACWAGRTAKDEKDVSKADDYRREAFELVRQSISTMHPLERRALLSYAEADKDLEQLAASHATEIARLWRLIPGEEARFRELDVFVNDVGRFAMIAAKESGARVLGIAVVGAWALGEAPTNAAVDIILLTDEPDRFARSDRWLEAFGWPAPAVLRRWRTRSLYRPRVELSSGLKLDFVIGAPSTLGARPLGDDLVALAAKGFSVLHDQTGALSALLARAAQAASRSSDDKKEA
jgi:tetratricopeptide (TPR) repeat protein